MCVKIYYYKIFEYILLTVKLLGTSAHGTVKELIQTSLLLLDLSP